MFVHHLIGKSYKDSANIRRSVFKGINDVLKQNGKLLILDNFNDGFLFDSVACRIIYTLTTCHNSVLSKFFYRMGANSAGSGVCMMSEKMWENLLTNTGFKIVQKECSKTDKWKFVKK